jgi:hypothetical protein
MLVFNYVGNGDMLFATFFVVVVGGGSRFHVHAWLDFDEELTRIRCHFT